MRTIVILVFGFFLILLGTSFLFDTFHIFNFAGYFLKLWPLLLVVWGLSKMIHGRFYWGLILISLGLLFLISNFSLVSFNVFVIFWPLLIILLGFSIIANAFKKGAYYENKTSVDSSFEVSEKGKSINEVNVLGGKKIKIDSSNTDGGSIVTVLGSTTLDIVAAKIDKKGAVLEVVNVLGETTIIIADNVEVKLDSVPILGNIDDQRKRSSVKASEGKILIKAVAVMGAINIR